MCDLLTTFLKKTDNKKYQEIEVSHSLYLDLLFHCPNVTSFGLLLKPSNNPNSSKAVFISLISASLVYGLKGHVDKRLIDSLFQLIGFGQ